MVYLANTAKLLATVLIALMAGCATPDITPEHLSKESLKQEQKEQFKQALIYLNQQNKRLAEVSRPLLKHSVPDCGKRTRYSAGIFLHRSSEYSKEQKAAAIELYGEAEQVQVLSVLDSGPANSKLYQGDQLLQINAQTIPQDSTANAIKLLNAAMSEGNNVELQIIRSKEKLTVTLKPEQICDYAVILSPSDAVNGYADGGRIIITSGLMRFLQQDEELAFIIAHELAHNTLDHIPKKLTNGALGAAIDIILTSTGFPSPLLATGIGINLYSQSFETEADLEAIRLMKNAGYKIQGLDKLWHKMASLHPSTITHGQSISHPTTVERSLRLRNKIQQISN
ncbi:MAG: M48 family metalloprotease [Neptuniibacter sp.]